MAIIADRHCSKCKRPETAGNGHSELRPYGKGGALICYDCMMSSPSDQTIAESQFGGLLDQIEGPAVLTPRGPKPLKGSKK